MDILVKQSCFRKYQQLKVMAKRIIAKGKTTDYINFVYLTPPILL